MEIRFLENLDTYLVWKKTEKVCVSSSISFSSSASVLVSTRGYHSSQFASSSD